MKKIAIIELSNQHAECIYTQLTLLKECGYHVTLICSDGLRESMDLFTTADEVFFVPIQKVFAKRIFTDTFIFKKIHQILSRRTIPKVILNTISSSSSTKRFFNCRFLKRIEVIGLVHDIAFLESKTYHKSVKGKLDKILVLSDTLRDKTHQKYPSLAIESFYSIFYQKEKIQEITKPSEEFWICIPGNVHLGRRDYLTLVERLKGVDISSNIKFVLLGRSEHVESTLVQDTIKKNGLEDSFIFFEGLISEEEFVSYMEASDVIMPLIHPQMKNFGSYFHSKISGAFNLAFGFNKPLFCVKELEVLEDLKDYSIFYTMENMVEESLALIKSKKKLSFLKVKMKEDKRFSLKVQSKKYDEFLQL